jgi:hypothetical protein
MREERKTLRLITRNPSELVKRSVIGPKWIYFSYGFLVFWQLLDGLTTKIGLDLGLAEVGTYAKGVLGDYGFWGLMAWKYSIVASVGAMFFLIYYVVHRYAPTRLNSVCKIMTVGGLLGGLVSAQVVLSNISQLQLVLH